MRSKTKVRSKTKTENVIRTIEREKFMEESEKNKDELDNENIITYETTLEEIKKLVHPCSCRACTIGCMYGSGTMTNEDIKKLSKYLNISENELKEKYLEKVKKYNTERYRPKILRKKRRPYGPCIFFKDGKCSIHEAKPLECQIAMGCKPYGEALIQWFHVHYFVNIFDDESLKEWELATKDKSIIKGADAISLKKKREKN